MFENINASNFDLRAGILHKNNFKNCNFFNSCFRGSKILENNFNFFILSNCDIKNIIFEKNIYQNTTYKLCNLFKSKFLNEELSNLQLKNCNTFLSIFEESFGYDDLELDKFHIIN